MNQVEIGLERMEHNWKRMSQYPQMKERGEGGLKGQILSLNHLLQ